MAMLVPEAQIEALRHIYSDFDKAFNRTRSRAAIDGSLLLLAIVDELRAIRITIQTQGERKPRQ